jgi:hypothetical protein
VEGKGRQEEEAADRQRAPAPQMAVRTLAAEAEAAAVLGASPEEPRQGLAAA